MFKSYIFYKETSLISTKQILRYKFDFTLTFFGILKPGDMTVSLLDYTEEDLSTDQVGE